MTLLQPEDLELARSFSELLTYVYSNDERVHLLAGALLKNINRITDITKADDNLWKSLSVPSMDM